MQFNKSFQSARRAGTPLLNVKTFDAASTVKTVRELVAAKMQEHELPMVPLLLWDCANGLVALNSEGKEQLAAILNGETQETTLVLPFTLKLAHELQDDSILFVSNSHLFWADEIVIQSVWNLRDIFKSNGSQLILLSSPGAILPAELSHDVLVLEEPLPDVQELSRIVSDMYDSAKADPPDESTLAKTLDALIGLPAFPAEQSVAMCLDQLTGTLDTVELWERKRQIIGQTPGLSVWKGTETLADVGGLENVKRFCGAIMQGEDSPKTIIFMDEIEKAFAGTGADTSGVKTELTGSMLTWLQDREVDGMIFIGLPGVSKSALVKSLGHDYNVPVINFDLAGMQSSLVGSSGANLRTAQKTVDAISGGKILAIATCNSLAALPPELRRRFNLGTFFFDIPSVEERAEIWSIYRKRYCISDTDPSPKDVPLTGAEIKEACRKAYRLRITLKESMEYLVPIMRSSADSIKLLRQNSSGKHLSASLPGIYSYTESDTAAVTSGRKLRN